MKPQEFQSCLNSGDDDSEQDKLVRKRYDRFVIRCERQLHNCGDLEVNNIIEWSSWVSGRPGKIGQ